VANTLHLPIYQGLTPGTSGNVWWEPASIVLANDLYPTRQVLRFKDTATLDYAYTRFRVPQNYVGTAKITFRYAVNATSGNASFKVNYKSIADAESFDPTTADETPAADTAAVPGTALVEKERTITLTSANLATGDLVEFGIGRDGAGSDTVAADILLLDCNFTYNDG
jgi:hypothetical protein